MRFGEIGCVWNAKRHKVKKIKRLAGTKYENTKNMDLDRLLRFCDLVFCQTAQSKENEKTSGHTIRKYIEIYFKVTFTWGGGAIRRDSYAFGMPNGTK